MNELKAYILFGHIISWASGITTTVSILLFSWYGFLSLIPYALFLYVFIRKVKGDDKDENKNF